MSAMQVLISLPVAVAATTTTTSARAAAGRGGFFAGKLSALEGNNKLRDRMLSVRSKLTMTVR